MGGNRPSRASRGTVSRSGWSRRSFLRLGGAGAIGVGVGGSLVACGAGESAGPAPGEPRELRASWFGGDDRHQRTVAAFDIIETKIDGLTVVTEYGGYDGYFDRVTTQISGGNAPALVQTNFGAELIGLASRNALEDLSSYRDNGLDLSALAEEEVQGGVFDGGLYGISLGAVSPAAMVDTTALDGVGLTAPESWDWTSFAEFATQVAEASDGQLAGTEDCSSYGEVLHMWLIGQGKEGTWTPEGALALTEADYVAWLEYWAELRESGGCVPIDVQAAHTAGDHPTNPVITGTAAVALQYNTTQAVWSGITSNTLAFARYPSGPTGEAGNFVRPAALWSVPRGTEDVETAVQVISLFLNDADVARELGFSRGVPNPRAVEAIGSDVSEADQALLDHTDAVLASTLYPPPLTPASAGGQLGPLLKNAAEEVGFGRASIADTAARVITEMQGMADA